MSTVVLGSGGHARVVAEILRLDRGEPPKFHVDDDESKTGETIDGIDVVGWAELRRAASSGEITQFVVGIGDNRTRSERASALHELGLEPVFTVHPGATVSSRATIAGGSVVMAGAIVNAGTVIRRHAVVNTGAIVDHDVRIDDGAFIGPGATLTGAVRIEREAMIGAGAVILPGIRIGAEAVVGAGAVVTENVAANQTVAGSPARPLL